MVRHIVMWTLKEEAEGASAKDNAAKMKEMLEALQGRIEGLQRIVVTDNVVDATPECNIVLCSDHDDVDALDHYQGHPDHQACVSFVKKVVSSRSAVDFEM